MLFLWKLFTNYIYKIINFYKYKKILEYVPELDTKIKDLTFINHCKNITLLTETINTICNNLNTKNIIISLSGGVDSMVLTTILHKLNFNIVAIHINYNNRIESKDEENFLREWCEFNNIKLYVKSINSIKRENIKRSNYEALTKNIRFSFYHEIMKKEKINYILLAHHKDDIIENIVANICRGRNYLDLAVIREKSCINNINIIRPMISFYKSDIYLFAHFYNIPYFKDTTPDWSVRGKYRNTISPALEDAFTQNVKENLLNISNQADDWNLLIEKEIIKPFSSKVIRFYDIDKTIVTIDTKNYINYPITFWNLIFTNLFNEFKLKPPSKKGIQSLINTIQLNKNKYIMLSNKYKCNIIDFKIMIEFKKE